MKFAAALIAVGVNAVKLYQEDEADWEYATDRVMSVIDWNGDNVVDEDELKDLIFIAETFEYIDEEEAEFYNEFAEGVIDYFGGPVTSDELIDEINWIHEQDNSDGSWDEDLAAIEVMSGILQGAEGMMIDLAVAVAFDSIDADGSDAIDVDEVDAMIDDLELDEDEAMDVYEAFEWADADDDMEVTYEEFGDAVWEAVEEDEDLRQEILDEAADFINEWDVDCTEDGDDNCDNERAYFREEIAGEAEE